MDNILRQVEKTCLIKESSYLGKMRCIKLVQGEWFTLGNLPGYSVMQHLTSDCRRQVWPPEKGGKQFHGMNQVKFPMNLRFHWVNIKINLF